MTDASLNEPNLRDRAVTAARGDGPFDLLIEGAQVACPITHRLRRADIGLVGPLIASVHDPAPRQALIATAPALATTASPSTTTNPSRAQPPTRL